MKTILGFEGNDIVTMDGMPPTKRRRRPDPFGHLTGEERIDPACELLALGVLRLAEKRGLTVPIKNDQ